MRRWSRIALVGGLLGASALVADAAGTAPLAVHAAAADQTHVTLLGDSTMAAMQWYQYDDDDPDTIANNDIREIVAQHYALNFSAESCRRLVIASCRGRFGYTPVSLLPYMQTTLKGTLGDALVIMEGYDDPAIGDGVDQIMAEAERQGVATVIWLTLRTGTNYVLPGGQSARDLYQTHNAALRAAATRHPSLHLLDWDTYSQQQPASWFASDGVHLNPIGAVGLAHYITAALDADPTISRCAATSSHTGVADTSPTSVAAPTAAPAGFVASDPTRVLDTRTAGSPGSVGAGSVVTLDLDKALPAGATGAVLSTTAVDSCRAGYLSVYPCGSRPPTSTMNFEVGRTTAGMAITGLTDRTVCIYSSAATDLVVDVIGAFSPTGAAFHPMTPTRWVDTRGGSSIRSELTGERGPDAGTDVVIAGNGGVPANATAAWINLTVADPSASTVLLAGPGPCNAAPVASTVNANAGRNTASAALVGLGPDGSICVHTLSGRSQIVVDVAGWFGPGDGGLRYSPQPPTRLIDTRNGPNGTTPAPSTNEVSTPVDSVSVLNAVAVDAAGAGYVSARPCGTDQVSSLINTTADQDTANITAVGPGSNGSVCVQASTPAQLVVDLVGSFAP
ncbi:MAG: hypothetical protein JWM34_4169 [Ilumatobacteraceae bacterium]|nr:hypothetical protein [Ilumatobacteraceae bacterium]